MTLPVGIPQTITVGAGAVSAFNVAVSGQDTTAFGLVAKGGGGGAFTEGSTQSYGVGKNGGSGGGGTGYICCGTSSISPPGLGTPGQGNAGGK